MKNLITCSKARSLSIDTLESEFSDVPNRFIAMRPPYTWRIQLYQTSLSKDVMDSPMSLSCGLRVNKEIDFPDCTRIF
ncbi:hypothetical protein PVL29_011986 [Vitis rotundifolia]|uniref:Uncharacterized protein n=1 Tax=Vitis rotundifolia TaxID=103349 RepID=A0AA38ZRJ2_VITRO|nr:hypothetical protein PVL29_011986 [Vitis rotundifolia]